MQQTPSVPVSRREVLNLLLPLYFADGGGEGSGTVGAETIPADGGGEGSGTVGAGTTSSVVSELVVKSQVTAARAAVTQTTSMMSRQAPVLGEPV